MTRDDILPEAQRALLPALAPLRGSGQVLYGGTAVALRLGHRASVDFDFFSERPFDEPALVRAMPHLAEATTLQRAPETWTLQVRAEPDAAPVKLSFFGGLSFGRVADPTPSGGGELLLASMDDLFGHKLKVLLQRVEAKDYQDIAAMLRAGLRIERGLGVARALFGPAFPPADALRALTYFEGGDLDALSAPDRMTLTDAAGRAGGVEEVKIISFRLGGGE